MTTSLAPYCATSNPNFLRNPKMSAPFCPPKKNLNKQNIQKDKKINISLLKSGDKMCYSSVSSGCCSRLNLKAGQSQDYILNKKAHDSSSCTIAKNKSYSEASSTTYTQQYC